MFSFVHKIKTLVNSLIRKMGKKKFMSLVGGGIVVIIVIMLLVAPSSSPQDETETSLPLVVLKTVEELSRGGTDLSLVGSVESVSQATLYAESAGIIKYVSYGLGDTVSRGAVIAEIENARERAALASADAALAQARAAQTRGTAQVYVNAANSYRNAFTSASDAIFGKTDTFFIAPRTSAPRLNISRFGEGTLEADRATINEILARWEANLPSAEDSARITELLEQAKNNLNTIKFFLDRLATIVNRQDPTPSRPTATLEAEKAGLFAARSGVNAALLDVTNTLNTLALTLPENQGGTGESDARIRAAEAARALAYANLEKTILRAPVSGTINSLDIKTGDFVGNFAPVATIANNTALEVVTYLSGAEQTLVHEGDTVRIEGVYEGTVVKIAPALNPTTKKLEVRIRVDNDSPTLINGSTVRISVPTKSQMNDTTGTAVLRIPLEALKLSADTAYVFSVDTATGELVAHDVTIGKILGDLIEVHNIDQSLPIVTDARGLSEGEQVDLGSE